MTIDIDYLQKWVGFSETKTDWVTSFPIAGLSATLDRPGLISSEINSIPLAAHWLYFLPSFSQSEIGLDGHKKRGDFLPPVELPRRMWAGGRLDFKLPIKLGSQIERISRIKQIRHSKGETGELVFVIVGHTISHDDVVLLEEDHNIVYRSAKKIDEKPKQGKDVPGKADWTEIVKPDPVLLFRYSALTFNSHRIHYDRKYATEIEGYPGLVVHGPLLATMLINFFDKKMPNSKLNIFEYKALSPIFDTAEFTLNGMIISDGAAKFWVANSDGKLAMLANIEFSN